VTGASELLVLPVRRGINLMLDPHSTKPSRRAGTSFFDPAAAVAAAPKTNRWVVWNNFNDAGDDPHRREKSRNSKYAAGHLIYILGAQLRLVVC
jgi:hypothetical protein